MSKYLCGSCGYPELKCECVVDAQHEETGRMWRGPLNRLPPRYRIIESKDRRAGNKPASLSEDENGRG